MAKTARIAGRLETFDRERSFVVNRVPFRFAGRDMKLGEAIDKSQTDTRRLRLLWEQRVVKMCDVDTTPLRPRRPLFSNLPIEALRDWLRAHGIIPRINTAPERLVERANEMWTSLHGDDNAQRT